MDKYLYFFQCFSVLSVVAKWKSAYFSVISLLMLLNLNTQAQSNVPVSCSPMLMHPYTLNLSDYSAIGSQKLMVRLYTNDLEVSQLPVKLLFKIESVGITIETPPTIVTAPIYLDGGSTHMLFGQDLYDYFKLKNLEFKGITKEAYQSAGQLPEGFYRFSVSVVHYFTGRLVSNVGTTSAWIVVGKPPMLKFPLNEAYVGDNVGMPITFSWLASNAGSPAAIGNIQYKLELWEMRVANINPNVVVASMPVFFEENTFNTAHTFYPSTMPMEPGMQYAWRVTASDIAGLVPFEQKGQSEVRTFIYKASCDSVSNLQSEAKGNSGQFSWTGMPNHTSYNVELKNAITGTVKPSETFENSARFFGLDYGSVYEMRVQSVCNSDPTSVSDYTQWRRLEIPIPEPAYDTASCPNCGCDDNMANAPLDNSELNYDLQEGDTIQNRKGSTRLIIKEISANNGGAYEGVCYFWVEIWGLKVPCNYSSLQLNTDNIIINLELESINDPTFLVDVDAVIADINDITERFDILFDDLPRDTISYDGDIETVYVNDNGQVIAVEVGEDGKITEHTIGTSDDLEKVMITDEDGEEYVVTKKGDVMGSKEYLETGGGKGDKIEDYNEEQENEAAELPSVQFTADANQLYGFDAYSEIKTNIQSQYPVLKGTYRPAYKSVASFKPDVVAISGAAENTLFRDNMGIPAPLQGDKLTLIGGSSEFPKSLYALHPVDDTTEQIIGKLNVLSYAHKTKKLVIVSVNGAQVPDAASLQADLDRVYKQSVISWEVTTGAALSDVSFQGDKMSHGGSGITSPYNADQKTIINAYDELEGAGIEKDVSYLFFISEVVDREANIAGYMPLKYNCGFIYGLPNNTTIAHELGHGAFNLYHTFSSENNIASEGSTQNLMDYAGGSELWKYQWDYIHDPQNILFAWGVDEEESEYSLFSSKLSNVYLNDENLIHEQTYYFINEFDSELNFVSKKTLEDETKEAIKVNWNYESVEEEQVNSLSLAVNTETFGNDSIIDLKITDNVILGQDSSQIFHLRLLDISFEREIINYLLTIINPDKRFNELKQLIIDYVANNNYNPLLTQGAEDKYISRGMSNLISKIASTAETDLEKYFSELYEIDVNLQKEAFTDDIVLKANDLLELTDDGYILKDEDFKNTIISLFEKNSEESDKASMETDYKSKINNLVISELKKEE